MASTAVDETGNVINSEAAETHGTLANQGTNTSDATREHRTAHHTSESPPSASPLFALPVEIRAMIFGFVCTDDPQIKLPGPLPASITTIMLAWKDPSWTSEVVEAV
ncbi:hypothetical protein J7T55_015670 [Diaporthe amygdali]|uniref:uncharacterized protein n=1 Tax=Phomopsis amygdali TaxID=1214568 RepID=UPI0022FE07BF|nr:uncharacterized protein J7T55_015670 [Diaporthe amygdali]KAJ0120932.1 hypothetical protein J7T55_015670 [Diaporthe amygdali]